MFIINYIAIYEIENIFANANWLKSSKIYTASIFFLYIITDNLKVVW